MIKARIYQPPKSAMQSGRKNKGWCLEFLRTNFEVDDIMGWLSSSDIEASELKFYFNSQEEAEKYAKSQGIEYISLDSPKRKNIIKKSYVNNYKIAKKSVEL